MMTLSTLLVQAGEDIRGLRGPLEIVQPWPWLSMAAASVAVGAIGLWAVRAWRRRARPEPTPRDVALAALDEAKSWIDGQRPREFAIAVSDAVRWYLERRFDLAATQRTTDEFVAQLRADPPRPLSPHRESLAEFLACADRAKFASLGLPPREMGGMLEAARQLVEATAADLEEPAPVVVASVRPDAQLREALS